MNTDGRGVAWEHHRLPVWVPAGLGGFAVVGGGVALAGWHVGVERLTDWMGTGISIFPNTAMCLLWCGVAVVVLTLGRGAGWSRVVAGLIGLTTIAVAATVLFQHVSGVSVGIDTLLYADPAWGHSAAAAPMRMGIPACVSFLLLGIAVALRSSGGERGRSAVNVLGLACVCLSGLSLTGYLYGAQGLYALPRYTGIALQSALGVMALGAAVLCLVPERGLVGLLLRRDTGGMLVRRLLPVVIGVALLLGGLRVAGEEAGLYDSAFGTAARTFIEVCMFVGLLSWAAGWIGRSERAVLAGRAELANELEATKALQRVSARVIGPASSGVVFDQVLVAARTITGAGMASLQSFNSESGEMVLIGYAGFEGKRMAAMGRSRPDPRDGSACAVAFATWERVDVEDVLTCTFMVGAPVLAAYAELGVRSVMATPLITRSGELVGMLSVYWDRPHRSGEDDLRQVDVLARLTADIIERRRVEAERAKDQRSLEEAGARMRAALVEARRASEMKDEFLATLSHELRTPMTAILGWAQMLRRAGEKGDFKQGLEVIERNAQQQSRIIEDLLDMSRIIAGKVELSVQPVLLRSVIAGSVEGVAHAAKEKGVEIGVVDGLGDGGDLLIGDPARLQQVVVNLLSNAVKFSERGQRVRVRCGRAANGVEVEVRDEGVGIRGEFLPHVFDRFRQQDSATTRRHGGLGLGLAIVKQLVELHGGTVRVVSDGEGRGASFTVWLPTDGSGGGLGVGSVAGSERAGAGVAESAVAAAGAGVGRELEGMSLLVVDDEPDACQMLKVILSERGAEVRTASSAALAAAALAERMPDVLLSDIGMPGEDGHSLARRLRKMEGGGGVYAVALTAFARNEDRQRSAAAGFDLHVSKPVEVEMLVGVIGQRGRERRDALAR